MSPNVKTRDLTSGTKAKQTFASYNIKKFEDFGQKAWRCFWHNWHIGY